VVTWTAGFHWWRFGNTTRTQNVSEYMLVLALCLVSLLTTTVHQLIGLKAMKYQQLATRSRGGVLNGWMDQNIT